MTRKGKSSLSVAALPGALVATMALGLFVAGPRPEWLQVRQVSIVGKFTGKAADDNGQTKFFARGAMSTSQVAGVTAAKPLGWNYNKDTGQDETIQSQWGGCGASVMLGAEESPFFDLALGTATVEINSITRLLDPLLDQRDGPRIRFIALKNQLLLCNLMLKGDKRPSSGSLDGRSPLGQIVQHFDLNPRTQVQDQHPVGGEQSQLNDKRGSRSEVVWTFDRQSREILIGHGKRRTLYDPSLWVVMEPSKAHGKRLADATEKINRVLSRLRSENRDRNRSLAIVQVGARFMLVWARNSSKGSSRHLTDEAPGTDKIEMLKLREVGG